MTATLTLTDRQAEIAGYASEGLTLSQISDEIGITPNAVRAAARRAGVRVTKEYERSYREICADMKPMDAIEYLLGVIELSVPQLRSDSVVEELGIVLTKQERRVFLTLHSHLDNLVTRSGLMDAVFCEKLADDVPDQAIIAVLICKVRAAIKGTTFEISTVWGVGYRMQERKTCGHSVTPAGTLAVAQ